MKNLIFVLLLTLFALSCSTKEVFNTSDYITITKGGYTKEAPEKLSRYALSERNPENKNFLIINELGECNKERIQEDLYLEFTKILIKESVKNEYYYNKYCKEMVSYSFSITDSLFIKMDLSEHIIGFLPLRLSFDVVNYLNTDSYFLHYKFNDINFSVTNDEILLNYFLISTNTNNYNIILSKGKITESYHYGFYGSITYAGEILSFNKENFDLRVAVVPMMYTKITKPKSFRSEMITTGFLNTPFYPREIFLTVDYKGNILKFHDRPLKSDNYSGLYGEELLR